MNTDVLELSLNWGINGVLLTVVCYLAARSKLASHGLEKKKKRKPPRDAYGMEGTGNTGAIVGKDNIINHINVGSAEPSAREKYLMEQAEHWRAQLEKSDAYAADYKASLNTLYAEMAKLRDSERGAWDSYYEAMADVHTLQVEVIELTAELGRQSLPLYTIKLKEEPLLVTQERQAS